MKALMPNDGCRKLADSFNRRFAASKKMTVSKTYVSNVIRQYQYEIQVLRNNIKHRIPKPMPINRVWGIDLMHSSKYYPYTNFTIFIVIN